MFQGASSLSLDAKGRLSVPTRHRDALTEQAGGQLTITTEVENWPGETEIQGPDLMVKMEAHARAMGARIFIDTVTKLDLKARPFVAHLDSGARITADAVMNEVRLSMQSTLDGLKQQFPATQTYANPFLL